MPWELGVRILMYNACVMYICSSRYSDGGLGYNLWEANLEGNDAVTCEYYIHGVFEDRTYILREGNHKNYTQVTN